MLTLAPETEALVRAKAARAGKTPDEVIRDALTGRGATETKPDRVDRAGLAKLLATLDTMTAGDRRPAKAILDEGWGH